MLNAWNSFYVLTGSSAAALTGLMFVVVTLVRDSGRGASEDGLSTFSTPTVFHFCSALFISALMSVPFPSLVPVAVLWGLVGVVGLGYVVQIARQTRKLKTYRPDAEDWSWNVALPFVAYAILIGGALVLHTAPSLYAPGAAVILLIFIGIHNAWDVVTFLATGKADSLPDPPAKNVD